MLVSKFFESRVSIVFTCVFSQDLARCIKCAVSVSYLGKILYSLSMADFGELVHILS